MDKTEKTNSKIILSIIANLGGKIFMLLQTIVIAYKFGANADIDIFMYMMALIIMLAAVGSAINQQVLVHSVINVRLSGSKENTNRYISSNYINYVLIGLVVVSAFFFFRAEIFAVTTEFTVESLVENDMTVILLLGVMFFSVINAYLLDLFTAYKIFVLPMINDLIKSILIILFVLVPGGAATVTIAALGMFAAYFLQFLVLNISFMKLTGFRFNLKRFRPEKGAKANIMFVVLAQLLIVVLGILTMKLKTGFSEGTYAAIENADKIYAMIYTVFIGQLTTVVGIHLIEAYTNKDYEKLNDSFSYYMRIASYLLIPVCCVLLMNSELVISILFERGKYTQDVVEITANCFKVLAVTIILRLMDAFVIRLIIVKQLQKSYFLYVALSNLASVGFMLLLKDSIGYMSYPVGSFLGYLVYVVVLWSVFLRKEFDFIKIKPILSFFAVNIAINLFILAGAYKLDAFLPDAVTLFGKIGYIVIYAVVYMVIYFMISLLYKQNRKIIFQTLPGISRFLQKNN